MKKNRSKSRNSSITSPHGSDHGLSPNEISVRQILAHAKKPLSAYDIIPILSKNLGHAIAPVTVYRALKHLVDRNIIARIESKNAYIVCQNPNETHDCLFFICHKCGVVTEAPGHAVSQILHKESRTLAFVVDRPILEIIGQCYKCSQQKS